MKYITYTSNQRVFVTTPKDEKKFLKGMKEWGYNVGEEFDREENEDVCVEIVSRLALG